MLRLCRAVLALVGVLCFAAPAHAQITERPSAFDSAGKVRTLTPAHVTRFDLKPPVWIVSGDFVEARLFTLSSGGHVLAVERRDGAVDRFALSDEESAALRAAIDAAMQTAGALVTEERSEMISEPARGAFVRNQMFLAAILYSPALAAQTNNRESALALYLLSAGASYFVVTNFANKTTVTRAQNDLATDGAFRGAFFANGILAAVGPDEPYGKVSALVTLGGALGGSAFGFRRAHGLTDGEAKAAKSASSYMVYTTVGLLGLAGIEDKVRIHAGSSVAAGLAGYMLGPRYPRRASYTVTAGDVNTLWIGSALGMATAFTPLVGMDSIKEKVGWAAFTAGLLGGAYVAERVWVRPYDHTQGEVAQIWLGTIAGGLMGGSIVVLGKPSNESVSLGLVTGGAMLGALGAQLLSQPARARPRSALRGVTGERDRATVEWTPAGLALAAASVRGNHGLLTIRF